MTITPPTQAPAGVRPSGGGTSAPRPDATPKVTGQFAYGSDLWMDDMIWGVTLRSPHPYAKIRSIAIGEALATGGVYAVLTHDDVPGQNVCGLELADQPVLAEGVVRYQGEPVALVAADHPEIARQAAKKIAVEYEVLHAGHRRRGRRSTRPRRGCTRERQPGPPPQAPQGRPASPRADVVVTGTYQVGMQDQAFLGPEAGLAVPDGEGGVDLYVATQWLHVDQRQICAALGLPPEQVRLVLAGVGGAFGGREDLSMHVHACMLALHTGKPVKMVYNREESFFGHVHRHPATMRYEHGARPGRHAGLRQGGDLPRRRRLHLEHPGRGRQRRAPWASGRTWCRTCTWTLRRLHQQPAVRRDARLRVGAGRVRLRGADGQAGGGAGPGPGRAALPQRDRAWAARRRPGRSWTARRPVAELLRRLEAMPLPATSGERRTARPTRPARPARRGGQHHPRRGRACAASATPSAYKNVGFSEGFDDYSTARVRLEVIAAASRW